MTDADGKTLSPGDRVEWWVGGQKYDAEVVEIRGDRAVARRRGSGQAGQLAEGDYLVKTFSRRIFARQFALRAQEAGPGVAIEASTPEDAARVRAAVASAGARASETARGQGALFMVQGAPGFAVAEALGLKFAGGVAVPPKSCPDCEGDGREWDAAADKFKPGSTCPTCKGTGYDPRDKGPAKFAKDSRGVEIKVGDAVMSDSDPTDVGLVRAVSGDRLTVDLGDGESMSTTAGQVHKMEKFTGPATCPCGKPVEMDAGVVGRHYAMTGSEVCQASGRAAAVEAGRATLFGERGDRRVTNE